MGHLAIFTGGSGSGKNTIARKVIARLGCKQPIILSYTTRERRPCDQEDEYAFVTREWMDEAEATGKLLWRVGVLGNEYAYVASDFTALMKPESEGVIKIVFVTPDKVQELLDFFRRHHFDEWDVFFTYCSHEAEIRRRLIARDNNSETLPIRLRESMSRYSEALRSTIPYIYLKNETLADLDTAVETVMGRFAQPV